jgi:hypothetical protein
MNIIIGKLRALTFPAEAGLEFLIVVESAYPICIVREMEQDVS